MAQLAQRLIPLCNPLARAGRTAPKLFTRTTTTNMRRQSIFHAARALSSSPTIPGLGHLPPTDYTISMEQALGTAETVLLYLEHGMPGKQLDEIKERKGDGIGKRYRDMMQVFLQTQLHVVVPFGFVADEKGVQDFAAALMHLMAASGQDHPDVSELQKVSQETMNLMLRRAFGITEIPQLPIEKVRHLAALVSSNMQDEAFLNQAERLYKEKTAYAGSDKQKLVQALTELQDELLVPCYLSVLAQAQIPEIPQDELGYVVLQTIITQGSGDVVVAQNMSSALMALNARAPIMQFGA